MNTKSLSSLLVLFSVSLFLPAILAAQADVQEEKKIKIVTKKVDEDGKKSVEKIVLTGEEAKNFDVDNYISEEVTDYDIDIEIDSDIEDAENVDVRVENNKVIIIEDGRKTVINLDEVEHEEIHDGDKHIVIKKKMTEKGSTKSSSKKKVIKKEIIIEEE